MDCRRPQHLEVRSFPTWGSVACPSRGYRKAPIKPLLWAKHLGARSVQDDSLGAAWKQPHILAKC